MVGGGGTQVDPHPLGELGGARRGHEVAQDRSPTDHPHGAEAIPVAEEPDEVAVDVEEVRSRLAHPHGHGPGGGSSAERPVTVADHALEPGRVDLEPAQLLGVVLVAHEAAHRSQLLGERGELLVVGATQRGEPVGRAAPPLQHLEHGPAAPWHGEVEIELGEAHTVHGPGGAQVEAGAPLLPGRETPSRAPEDAACGPGLTGGDQGRRRDRGRIELVRERGGRDPLETQQTGVRRRGVAGEQQGLGRHDPRPVGELGVAQLARDVDELVGEGGGGPGHAGVAALDIAAAGRALLPVEVDEQRHERRLGHPRRRAEPTIGLDRTGGSHRGAVEVAGEPLGPRQLEVELGTDLVVALPRQVGEPGLQRLGGLMDEPGLEQDARSVETGRRTVGIGNE